MKKKRQYTLRKKSLTGPSWWNGSLLLRFIFLPARERYESDREAGAKTNIFFPHPTRCIGSFISHEVE